MIVREYVEAVVVSQHHRISGRVERSCCEFAARWIRRVIESTLHTTVCIVEHHLLVASDDYEGGRGKREEGRASVY